MNKLLIVFTLFAAAGCAQSEARPDKAANLRMLAWDRNPAVEQVTEYRIYGNGRFVASVQSNSVQLPRGKTYFVTAVNMRGEGPQSSAIKL